MQKTKSQANPYRLRPADLEWQGDTPRATDYQDIYFLPEQGLAESDYVFLQHNRLAERWQQLAASSSPNKIFTLAETGFGSGLNFLASWRLWEQSAPADWQLHYISTEKHPLTPEDLARALGALPELTPWVQPLLANYPLLIAGQHLLKFQQGRVNLHLLLGDTCDGLEQLRASDHPAFDHSGPTVNAWFLDGFAPSRNPSMWNDTLYRLIRDLSETGTSLATFTAASDVRRGLERQGFKLSRPKGFGSKRNMLCGVLDSDSHPSPSSDAKPQRSRARAPWYINLEQHTAGKRVAVIGAGLAGLSSAHAMAQRGWHVTVVERAAQLAHGASGNPQGMFYTKLSAEAGALNQFALSSYLYALRYYQNLAGTHLGPELIQFCGVLQLAMSAKDRKILPAIQQTFEGIEQLVQFVDARQASALAGIKLEHEGWFYPGAGWASPFAICQAYSQHPNIEMRYHSEVLSIQSVETRTNDHVWQLHNAQTDERGKALLEAEVLIIANSRDAIHFEQSCSLPLQTIRGQISEVPDSSAGQLKTVLCHEGYVTPPINGQLNLGATFDKNDDDTTLRSLDHQRNIDSLLSAVPALTPPDPTLWEQPAGRAALRCSSPDYLPLVGPLPQRQALIERFAALGKDARQGIAEPGCYYPGLYINVAHGSRGLTSTPLCSELLAALICAEPLPLPRQLATALNPARFTIRDVIRNKL